ncbi:MAG: lipase family protein, partial [Gammaproteobacteria bacterium]
MLKTEIQRSTQQKFSQNAINWEDIPDKRPLDYVYALMSKQVYEGSKLQKGDTLSSDDYTKWKIEEVVYDINSEYFGAIYVNRQDNWIVVAHRGTNTLKACMADLEGIYLNKFTRQKQVVYELVDRAIKLAKDKEFNLSFTGHSLGAFLAELSVFYCYSKFEFPYVHAVTFESPGSEESLKALESHMEAERVTFSELDVVGYVSYPNIINTCNHHIGSLYQVEPLLSDHSQYFSSWYQYTEQAHSIDRIVKVFENGKIGRPLRLQYLHDWPMGNQRKKFFEIAKLNEDGTYTLSEDLSAQKQFILDCQAHHSFNHSLCT